MIFRWKHENDETVTVTRTSNETSIARIQAELEDHLIRMEDGLYVVDTEYGQDESNE